LVRRETAALRDFNPAYVACGSNHDYHASSSMTASAGSGHAVYRAYVPEVPKAAVSNCSKAALFDHLVGNREQHRRHFEAERLRGALPQELHAVTASST
jgi:hypothetical protein